MNLKAPFWEPLGSALKECQNLGQLREHSRTESFFTGEGRDLVSFQNCIGTVAEDFILTLNGFSLKEELTQPSALCFLGSRIFLRMVFITISGIQRISIISSLLEMQISSRNPHKPTESEAIVTQDSQVILVH